MDVQVKRDHATLDSGRNASYIKLLEEGKKLTLNNNTFMSQYQTILKRPLYQHITVINTLDISFYLITYRMRSQPQNVYYRQ